jgi:hypothetical protein
LSLISTDPMTWNEFHVCIISSLTEHARSNHGSGSAGDHSEPGPPSPPLHTHCCALRLVPRNSQNEPKAWSLLETGWQSKWACQPGKMKNEKMEKKEKESRCPSHESRVWKDYRAAWRHRAMLSHHCRSQGDYEVSESISVRRKRECTLCSVKMR